MIALSALMQAVFAPDPGKALAALLGIAYVLAVILAVAVRGAGPGNPAPKPVGILSDLAAFTLFIAVTFALSVVIFGLACNKTYLKGIDSASANNLYIEAAVLLGCFFLGAFFLAVLAARLFIHPGLKTYGKWVGTAFALVSVGSLLLTPVYAGALQAYYFGLPRVEVAGAVGPNLLLYENGGLMYIFNENTLTTEIYASGDLDEFALGSFGTGKTLSACYTVDTASVKNPPVVTDRE